ncbi:uncharacterized protein A4U43_C09F7130 [Asparagus officinalis]|uniref:Uncharacterized protein n=1 Tax=Asparagus officinalis TaxID=4686 RepID=A0A5P1E947_ASPOF|nr:uncharacterized protein A4U43_C09F7130 [Asparagus officinalis]
MSASSQTAPRRQPTTAVESLLSPKMVSLQNAQKRSEAAALLHSEADRIGLYRHRVGLGSDDGDDEMEPARLRVDVTADDVASSSPGGVGELQEEVPAEGVAYVADWTERRNVGSRYQDAGLGFTDDVEPEWWARTGARGGTRAEEGGGEVVQEANGEV